MVRAEAWNTCTETGSIPNSLVAPGAPLRPCAAAVQVDKCVVWAARSHPCDASTKSLNVHAEGDHDGGCARLAVTSAVVGGPRDCKVSVLLPPSRHLPGGGGVSAGGRPYCPTFGILHPHRVRSSTVRLLSAASDESNLCPHVFFFLHTASKERTGHAGVAREAE